MQRYLLPPILVAVVAIFALIAGCTERKEPAVKSPVGHGEHESHGPKSISVESAQLILRSIPEQPRAGEPIELKIMLHDEAGKMLKAFEPTHTKLAHLIIVREGLDEFAHLHPIVDAQGNMTATHSFPVGGTYLVFLDYKPSGMQAATAQAKLVVEGESPSAPALIPDVPGKVRGEGVQAEVAMNVISDKAQAVTFSVQDENGEPVKDLQPYLGAMGHFVVLSADGGQYVHAHPLTESASDGIVKFEVHFPAAGTYKGWGQFQLAGKVVTIPIVMQVADEIAPH